MKTAVKKGICTAAEAREILGLGRTEFYRMIADPNTRIRPSSKQGKYIYSSVRAEFKRLHGVSYEEAI